MIQFDEATHSYKLDGAPVPGVTSILAPLSAAEYRGVSAEVMERAAMLGRAVHKMIELDLRRVLDEDALDELLRPYLAQWRAFLTLSGFDPLLSEAQVASRRYGYAGTLDLFGRLNGDAALIDAKRTAAVPRTAGPQTAGYEIALRECLPDVVDRAASGAGDGKIYRYALHLTPERWRLVPLKDPADARVFLAALTLNQWSQAA